MKKVNNQCRVNEILQRSQKIAVVQVSLPALAVKKAQSLLESGINAMEIAYRDLENFDATDECIRAIRDQVPGMNIGAATITNPGLAKRAKKAGAQFIFSAGFNPDTVKWCVNHGMPVIPGVATPGEIEQAMQFGLTYLKLFPVTVLGGTDFLKALKGPYPQIKFMVSGGVNEQNWEQFLSLDNVFAVSGSWLAK